jgi:hypothetical protein
MKAFLPWLTAIAVVFLLSAVGLRTLATIVAVAWFIYAAYTWIRAARRR